MKNTIIGIIVILKFVINFSEINLIVVSEKIIKNKPIKKVAKRILANDELSFEDVINI